MRPPCMASSPAPGVLPVTGEWAQLIIWEGVVKVTVVGMVEHGFDALPGKVTTLESNYQPQDRTGSLKTSLKKEVT